MKSPSSVSSTQMLSHAGPKVQTFHRRPFPMGHKDLSVHLATVSGVATTKAELIRWFDQNVPAVEFITTKSFQVRPNPGNREPVICETSFGNFGNSVGLRNPGMEVAIPQLQELRNQGLKAWLNVSVSADNPDDFITLVRAFDSLADSIELNFSCPHASSGYGASIGVDKDIAASYVEKICQAYPERKSLLFPKLTPNVSNLGEIAKAVIDAGADGISAINTVGPVNHIDSASGLSILNSKKGGKGGKSGLWIREDALRCIKEIRNAVGDDVPIIGMGGVSDAKSCAELIKAGADVVGIGSALAHVGQKNWPAFFDSVKADATAILTNQTPKAHFSKTLVNTGTPASSLMQYRRFTVTEKKLHCEDTLLLTLDGEMNNFKAGEFVFLWLPEVGEKPFSVAKSAPLTFIIKKRGIFTKAIFDSLKVGQSIYLRGPYGAEIVTPKANVAIVLAGGTGEAVALPLAEKLRRDGTAMHFLVGTSVPSDKGILQDELSQFGSYTCISDAGKPGRVLDSLSPLLSRLLEAGTRLDDLACYLIGPEIFMKIAATRLQASGIDSSRILLSMERNSMCGIGLCGECSCGGHLSCQWGTFMSLSFLESEHAL